MTLVKSAEDERRLGQLIHFAIDQIWYSSREAAPDGYDFDADPVDYHGCCPVCCAPCHAIAELRDAGTLDQWVLAWPDTLPGTSWWDEEKQQVRRDWLEQAWAYALTGALCCHCPDDCAKDECAE